MIRLTRLRNQNPLYLNPDHIERLDCNHETIVHLFNGAEYVVTETAEEIVALVTAQRARILAVAARLNNAGPSPELEPSDGVPAALLSVPSLDEFDDAGVIHATTAKDAT